MLKSLKEEKLEEKNLIKIVKKNKNFLLFLIKKKKIKSNSATCYQKIFRPTGDSL